MKRRYSLKKNRDFHFTYRLGKSAGSRFMTLIYVRDRRKPKKRPAESRPPVLVGFSVSRKLGNSVTRNRVKRRMREAFSPMLSEIKPGHNLIFIAREPIKSARFADIQSTMRYLLRKADLLYAGNPREIKEGAEV